jgi:hypothetical protein
MKKNLLLLVLGLLCTQYSFAQTKTWAGTTTDWHTPENWNPVGVPTSSDDVIINTATTNPVISSDAAAKTISISVTGALLTVNSGATLTVINSAGSAMLISNGGLTNNGTIVASDTNPVEVSQEAAIFLSFSATLTNNGTITVNGGANFGIRMATSTINNQSGGIITSNGKEVIRFGDPNAIFNNNAGATLNGTSPATAFTMLPGKLNNSGLVDITGNMEVYNTNSVVTNSSCGIIKVNGNYFNQTNATTTSTGLFQINGNFSNPGTFTNNGVIVANGDYPTFTNRRIRINNNATNTTIFTISTSAGSSTINGIFLDAAATVSAGTYTQNNNTFVPGNFPGGTYTLYAKISYGSCTFIVPFSYTRPPTRRYVKTTAAGTGDGTSWANASNDIQAMINASADGDSVWVAAGAYVPLADGSGDTSPSNSRYKLFYMRSGIKLFGGFVGTETTFSQRDFTINKTILSGDIDNNDTNTDSNSISESYTDIQGSNSYHIMGITNCNTNTTIDGIIFTGGKGEDVSGYQSVNSGIILHNTGAAIAIEGAGPTIKNCTFIGNDGYFGITCHNNSFLSNQTDPVKIINCYYLNNRATYGGGIFSRRGNTNVDNTVFFNNTSNYGGAIHVFVNMSTGGLCQFTNTTIVNNYSTNGKSVHISNGDVSFINTIIWNATPYNGGNIYKSGGTLTSSYSILQNSGAGGTWNGNYGTDGGNNIDGDPLFTNISDIDGADNKFFTSDDGLSLTGCSPGVNTGTNTNVFVTDITNSPRPYNSGITDIGAYERQSAPTLTTNPTNVSVNKTVVCPGNTVTLSAQCSVGTVTWYNQATGGTAIGTGNSLNQSPNSNTIYYSACEVGNCKSERVATAEITVTNVSSNVSLTASISGTAIYASSNTITATNKVLNTANVQYLANNSILLDTGFEASSGAVFVAKVTSITACN